MAEKDGDHEANAYHQSEERKRQRKIKRLKYFAIFIVFQVIVITIFSLTVMKAKTPKLRLASNAYIQTLTYSPATPSFDMSFVTQVRVRNPNWGPFKFRDGTIVFTYQGVVVGQVYIPNGKVGLRSTKKITVLVNVNSNALPGKSALGNELSNGLLLLTSTAELRGKVELMLIMKTKKTAELSCSMVFNLAARTLQNLDCD